MKCCAGRQTGSLAWRAGRGELKQTDAPSLSTGTRWRPVRSGDLKGALIRASGENEPSETADKVGSPGWLYAQQLPELS